MKLFSFLWKTSVATTITSSSSTKRFTKDPNKLPRIYLEKNKLITGTSLQLNPDILHYLKNVLRLKTGDFFRSFNENDGEYLCMFEQPSGVTSSTGSDNPNNNKSSRSSKKSEDTPIVAEKLKDPIPNTCSKQIIINNQLINLSFSLYFVPIKKTRLKQMLESCTELGVHSFVPVITQNMNNEYKDFESFQKLLIESVEQSEQFVIPKIQTPISLMDLLNTWKNQHNHNSNSSINIDSVSSSSSTSSDSQNNRKKLRSGIKSLLNSSAKDSTKTSSISASSASSTTIISPLYICRERMAGSEDSDQSFTTAIRKSLLSSIVVATRDSNTTTIATSKSIKLDGRRTTNDDTTVNEHATTADKSLSPRSLPLSSLSVHCGIFIGPEGGFTQQELSLFEQPEYSDFIYFVSLGQSVLRAETAAVYAVSIFMDTITSLESRSSDKNGGIGMSRI